MEEFLFHLSRDLSAMLVVIAFMLCFFVVFVVIILTIIAWTERVEQPQQSLSPLEKEASAAVDEVIDALKK